MTDSGWTKRYLGELVTVQGGFAFRSADFFDDGVPIVRMSDLDNGKIDLDGAARITEKKLKYLSNFALNDGDFLVGMSGSIENYAIVRKKDLPAYLNQRVGRFRLANSELADYGFVTQVALSDSYKSHVELLAAGAAQLNISPRQIESFCFDVPPKPEQAKIAEILSTVDQAIEQTEALIAKQQRIKTGLMQDLLTRGIDEHGNLRSEQTHQFKDSPLGRVPIEWDVQPCIEICKEIVVGIVIRPAQYYRPAGVPVLRSANVKQNRIACDDLVFMSDKDNEALSKSRLHEGDLVTVRTGYPGTTGVIPKELDGSNCVDIVISRPNHEKVRSEFLSMWVNSDHGKKQVLEAQGGLAQQHFNVGEMRKLMVKIPSIQEQLRIEKTLMLNSTANQELINHRQKLNSVKTALMQDLLTGKKRVTPLFTEAQEAGV